MPGLGLLPVVVGLIKPVLEVLLGVVAVKVPAPGVPEVVAVPSRGVPNLATVLETGVALPVEAEPNLDPAGVKLLTVLVEAKPGRGGPKVGVEVEGRGPAPRILGGDAHVIMPAELVLLVDDVVSVRALLAGVAVFVSLPVPKPCEAVLDLAPLGVVTPQEVPLRLLETDDDDVVV